MWADLVCVSPWPGTAPALTAQSPGRVVLSPRMRVKVTAMLPHSCGETRKAPCFVSEAGH